MKKSFLIIATLLILPSQTNSMWEWLRGQSEQSPAAPGRPESTCRHDQEPTEDAVDGDWKVVDVPAATWQDQAHPLTEPLKALLRDELPEADQAFTARLRNVLCDQTLMAWQGQAQAPDTQQVIGAHVIQIKRQAAIGDAHPNGTAVVLAIHQTTMPDWRGPAFDRFTTGESFKCIAEFAVRRMDQHGCNRALIIAPNWKGNVANPQTAATNLRNAGHEIGHVVTHALKDGGTEPACLDVVGYSHGGNVALHATKYLVDHHAVDCGGRQHAVDCLCTVFTPNVPKIPKPGARIGTHLNFYSRGDYIQPLGTVQAGVRETVYAEKKKATDETGNFARNCANISVSYITGKDEHLCDPGHTGQQVLMRTLLSVMHHTAEARRQSAKGDIPLFFDLVVDKRAPECGKISLLRLRARPEEHILPRTMIRTSTDSLRDMVFSPTRLPAEYPLAALVLINKDGWHEVDGTWGIAGPTDAQQQAAANMRREMEEAETTAAPPAGWGRLLAAGQESTDKRRKAREEFAERKANEMRSWLQRVARERGACLQWEPFAPDAFVHDTRNALEAAAEFHANVIWELLQATAHDKQSYTEQIAGSRARDARRKQLMTQALQTQNTAAAAIERMATETLDQIHKAAARHAAEMQAHDTTAQLLAAGADPGDRTP